MMLKKDTKCEYEIPLCDSLSLHYTCSVSQSKTKYKKTNGYYNNVNFYFYMPNLKKKVGRNWRASYSVLKKQLQDNGEKPSVSPPSPQRIQKALENLLRRNVGIALIHTKETAIRTIHETLDVDELLVFWLHRYKDIAALDTSNRMDEDRHKTFAKLCQSISGFKLSSLCTTRRGELSEVCHMLAADIKKALGHEGDTVTSNIRDKTQIIRFAIKLFMQEQDLDPQYALDCLIRESTPKKGVKAKIAANMRTRSLSVEKYRELYRKLAKESSSESVGLLFMLLLGVTAEEACGMNVASIEPILGYLGCYQIHIVQQHCKNNGKYILTQTMDEDDFRNIPIPEAFLALCKPFLERPKRDPLLVDAKGKRMKPDVLMHALNELLSGESNEVCIRDGKTQKIVNLSFLPSSYRESCRIFWKEHCGLAPGEIHYLGGLTPPDTASAHYIDYNNATKQYRMLKQLEYGIAMIANTGDKTADCFCAPAKKGVIVGGLESRATAQYLLKKPVKLTLSSRRGLLIAKGGRDE